MEKENLRVWEFLEHSELNYGIEDIKFINASFYEELVAEDWKFTRGQRTVLDHFKMVDIDGVPTKVVYIDERYEALYDSENRFVVDLKKFVRWYNLDGSIGLEKEIWHRTGKVELREVNRKIANKRLDYLETSAEELKDKAALVPEPYKSQFLMIAGAIETLFAHYHAEAAEYRTRQTKALETAIANEADAAILPLLAAPTAQPSAEYPQGLTAKNSLNLQLKGTL